MQKRQQLDLELKYMSTVLEESPATDITKAPSCFLTPPDSSRKSLETIDSNETSVASYSLHR